MGRKRSKASSSRSRSVKKEPQELSEEKLIFIEGLERSVQDVIQKLEKEYQEALEMTCNSHSLICAKLGEEVLNTRYYDVPETEPIAVPSVSTTTTTTSNRRRSKSCSSLFTVPKAPPERTVPRSGSHNGLASLFQTPGNQGIAVFNKMITPKVSANTPMTVMRRPRPGEWALSMSGSPLLVSTAAHENFVNINIPLDDGTVLSILPQRGLRRDDIPANLSTATRQQLEAVFQNLNAIL